MKGLRDTLAIAVIDEWSEKLIQDPPEFRPETFESLERSFMRIGKLLTDELERKDNATNS